MEDNLNMMVKRSDHGAGEVKKEKRANSSEDNNNNEEAAAAKGRNKRPHLENDINHDVKPSSPGQRDILSNNNNKKQVFVKAEPERFSTEPDHSMASSSSRKDQDEQLESAKAEMGEVREENQRLKMYLNRIMKDYQNLQMQFYDIVGQDSSIAKKSTATTTTNDHQEPAADHQLVSLTLGRFSADSSSKKDDHQMNKVTCSSQGKEGLSLGLDCKFEVAHSKSSDVDDEAALPNNPTSPTNSSQDQPNNNKEEETSWPPSKVLKTMRSSSSGDDEMSLQQNPVKKARVCVRARCDTPTMNDGCQWRKYGQKIAKGNPCPRAYYRCTVAPSCPVRKQVQRCADDMSILITTYEGNHNHPLPMSATAMASTTSAAASMLLSGSSSTSSQPGSTSLPTAAATPANLHGLNFYLSDNSKSKFYLPNSSLSTSSTHPTITLDLTSTPSSTSSFPFNRYHSVYPTAGPRSSPYPSTSLSFGSSEPNTVSSWGNGLLSYGSSSSSSSQPYLKTQIGALNGNSIYQSFMQKNTPTATLNPTTHQQPLTDTIAAATKAITADPNFQSALAAALTSIIGTGNNGGGGASSVHHQPAAGGGDSLGQKLKWSEHALNSSVQTVKGNSNVNIGCGSSFLNRSSPSNGSQAGSLMFLPPSLPFATPKSASTSPGDTRNHSN